jgi:type IV pilus assembly protein PilB
MSEASELLLVEMLIKNRVFDRKAFDEIMASRPMNETSIRSYIVKKGLVTEKKILSVLAREQHLRIASLTNLQPEPYLLAKVDVIQATSFSIFPLREEEGEVVLGMVDVLDTNIFDDLRFCFTFPFQVELISPEDHRELVSKFYSPDTGQGPEGSRSMVFLSGSSDDSDEENGSDPSVNDAPVVVLLNNILMQAINDHASDIHFEPFENEFKIRYRIDGTLYEMIPPPRNLALSVLSRIKVMARMNIAEKRVPQDGRISLKVNQKPVDLRVSTLPTAFGESAVLRVLDRSHIQLDLDKLGIGREHLKKIRTIIHKPNGIFIATGPTGAGKTTTLYSGLREINTIDSKIITTEDPVEYDIPGIMQVNIQENIGLTFAACLRSILRQDPDRIMVGEIRDLETMNMAIQASLTGHLVLTTLHTNDSASAITRLIDMGVEPFLICSALEGILAQRLVRRICPHCKTPFSPNEALLKLLNLKASDVGGKKFYKGLGCEECSDIGYRGRVGIYELMVINDEIRELIMKRSTANMIRECALKNGMVTLLEDGMHKVESGLTTAEELALWTTEQ